MVVSVELAERYWQSAEKALGHRVFLGVDPYVDVEPGEDAEWRTIVGVVGEIVQDDLTDGTRKGAYYLPHRQEIRRFTRLVVKTDGEPRQLLGAVRERIFALDPEIVLFWVITLEENVAGSLIHYRIPMQLLVVFAAVALLLAAVGVYGVLAQSVTQRSREIGIRMALGSSLSQIRRWVLRAMLTFVALGLALGLGLAVPLTRLMSSLLYEVHPTDPAVFLSAGIVIGVVALLAAAVPARRATRIDPVKVLTSD